MDFSKLSPSELREFLQVNGQVPGRNLIQQASDLFPKTDIYTIPVIDLYIASNLSFPESSPYLLSDLENLDLTTQHQFAELFSLEPDEPHLKDRIIHILRLMNLVIPDVDCSHFPSYSSSFSITQVICGSIRHLHPYNQYSTNECTPIGLKIATSLIKIASTRIFAEPEQSILELPVNSIDAYFPERTIGKFGLGFFSILYWLFDDPTRFLQLTSTYQEYNGNLCTWQLTIRNLKGDLQFQLNHLPPQSHTGTTISLNSPNRPLNTPEFMYQLEKLKYVNSVKILLQQPTRVLNELMMKPKKKYPEIQMIINPKLISVSDQATGISLHTLFSSLLVPSLSTKGIRIRTFVPSVNPETSIYRNTPSARFIILVGMIAVVSLPVPSDRNYHLILQLNPNVPLPVSRDDILIERPQVAEEFLVNLKHLRNQAIKHKLLYLLKVATYQYANYQPLARPLIDRFWDQTQQELEATNKFYVLFEYYPIFDYLEPGSFIPMDQNLSDKAERYLIQRFPWRTDIFFGKYVLFLPNLKEKATSAQTARFFFIRDDVPSLSTNYATDLTLAFPEEYLLPVDLNLGKEENQNLRDLIQDLHPELQEATYNLLLQYLGLSTYFREIGSKKLQTIIDGIRYTQELDLALTQELIIYMRIYMKLVIPKMFSYGTWQPLLKLDSTNFSKFLEKKKFPALTDSEREKAISFIRTYFRAIQPLISWEKYLVVALPTYLSFIEFVDPIFFSQNPENPLLAFLSLSNPLYVINKEKQIEFHGHDTFILTYNATRDQLIWFFHYSQNVYEYLLLRRLRKGPQNPDEILAILNYWRSRLNQPTHRQMILNPEKEVFEAVIQVPLQILLDLIRKTRRVLQSLNTYRPPKGSFLDQYRLGELIQYAFQHPELTGENFLEVQDQIHNEEESSSLQILEIAINEGTTRPFLQAVLIETFQNALDAIRESGVNGNVFITVSNYGEKSIALSINDPVGISSFGILALSIPFLSTKTPSELITGEMGSGFFNVYRESDWVYLDTLKDGKHVIVMDQPIRRNNRVVDVQRKIQVSSSESPNTGTELTIILTPDQRIPTLSEIFYLIQNVLALSHPVILNGERYEVGRELLAENAQFQFWMIPDHYTSWILTKNVPFTEMVRYFSVQELLPFYLHPEMTTGVLFNMKHGGYTPVQTRTRLNISEEKKKQLKDFLMTQSYRYILRKYLRAENPDRYIPNSTSTASLPQLRFTELRNVQYENLISFFLYYPDDQGKTLAEWINQMISLIQRQPVDSYRDQVRSKITDPEIFHVVWKWLLNKNQTFYQTSVRERPVKPLAKVEHFLRDFIRVYWEIGGELKIPQTNFTGPPPGLKLQGTEDAYSKAEHVIYLNPDKMTDMNTIMEPLEFRKLTNEDLIRLFRNPKTRAYFGVEYPSATLIHELAHAWRRTSHEGAHQPINLTLDGKTQEYNYEEAANRVYQVILQSGLTDRLIQSLQGI